jgi:predicted nuclease of restriction endonuclease-like (RecB) superfamily
MASEVNKKYIEVLQSLKEKIRQARLRATIAVNNELLKVYWEIGNIILLQQKNEGWGTKVTNRLAKDLKMAFPDMKGLSERNLVYMQTFAGAWPHFPFTHAPLAEIQDKPITKPVAAQIAKGKKKKVPLLNPPAKMISGAITQVPLAQIQTNTIVQESLAQLSWYHHITLLDKVKDPAIRLFYIEKAIKNGWSRDVMVHQIEGGLHKRQGALSNNFSATLPAYESELATQLFKDPYQFDFLMLGEEAKERDLENALMTHITKLLLELGDGFAFMGRQKRFEAGDKEFFIDLLFYHTKLRRHIIIDLKIGEFEPEFVSKMNLYLGLADDKLKGGYDKPATGLILCKTNNKIIAEYALRDTSKPIGIAKYKIAAMLPADIKGELPSIEELEAALEKEAKKFEQPLNKKIKAVLAKQRKK